MSQADHAAASTPPRHPPCDEWRLWCHRPLFFLCSHKRRHLHKRPNRQCTCGTCGAGWTRGCWWSYTTVIGCALDASLPRESAIAYWAIFIALSLRGCYFSLCFKREGDKTQPIHGSSPRWSKSTPTSTRSHVCAHAAPSPLIPPQKIQKRSSGTKRKC